VTEEVLESNGKWQDGPRCDISCSLFASQSNSDTDMDMDRLSDQDIDIDETHAITDDHFRQLHKLGTSAK
jgi:hypothetical protein